MARPFDIYDELGNLKQKTNRNNIITAYDYDELYRVVNGTSIIYLPVTELGALTRETGSISYIGRS